MFRVAAKHAKMLVPANLPSRIVEGRIKYPSGMSADAKDIISKLCQVDPSKRLGNLRGGAADVKSHPWFKTIDWKKLYSRQLDPPIKPHLTSATDTRNFEDYEDEPRSRTVYTSEMKKKYDSNFESF